MFLLPWTRFPLPGGRSTGFISLRMPIMWLPDTACPTPNVSRRTSLLILLEVHNVSAILSHHGKQDGHVDLRHTPTRPLFFLWPRRSIPFFSTTSHGSARCWRSAGSFFCFTLWPSFVNVHVASEEGGHPGRRRRDLKRRATGEGAAPRQPHHAPARPTGRLTCRCRCGVRQ